MSVVPPTDSPQVVEIKFKVPCNRANCAAWLGEQLPDVVADCLEACQASYNAIQREANACEAGRLSEVLTKHRNQSVAEKKMLQRELDALQVQLDNKNNEYDSKIKEIRSRYDDSLTQKEITLTDTISKYESKIKDVRKQCDESLAQKDTFISETRQKFDAESLANANEWAVRLQEREAVWSVTDKKRKEHIESLENEIDKAGTKAREKVRQDHEAELEREKQKYLQLFGEEKNERSRLEEQLKTHEEKKEVGIGRALDVLRREMKADFESREKHTLQQLQHYKESMERNKESSETHYADVKSTRTELADTQREHASKIQALNDKHNAEVQRLNAEKEVVLASYKDFANSFRGMSAVGKLGELFIEVIHRQLSLGELIPTSKDPGKGTADFMWSMEFAGGKMMALVEAKNVAEVHTVHDIKKFKDNIGQAAREGTINAAVKISLRARIGGKKQLEFDTVHGIPVLWVSREYEDDMPSQCLVTQAFTTMASAWPLLMRSKGSDDENAMSAIREHLDVNFQQADSLSKQITNLQSTVRANNRTIDELKKIRDAIVSAVDTLRLKHPKLNLHSIEDNNPDPFDDPEVEELLQCITNHKIGNHGKYPKNMDEVELSEGAKAFWQTWQSAIKLGDLVEKLKARARQGLKRKAEPPTQ